MQTGAKGVKIVLSGRIGGAEISRLKNSHIGSVPAQTMRENIDYAHVPALLKRGYVGVKVYIHVPGAFSLIVDMPDETWQKTISVHLNGTFHCLREAAKLMMTAGFGRIINIASIAGISGTVGSGEYGAAKAGIINLTKTAAKELGPYHITVNAIAPGMVGTVTNLKLKGKGSPFIEIAEKGTPTGRMTSPEEIAEAAIFLSSEAAGNINGQVIRLDGGATIEMGMDQFMRDFLMKKSPFIKSFKGD